MNKSAFAAPRCPGTLKEGFSSYCPATLRSLFDGKQVFHVLPNNYSEKEWSSARIAGDHYGGQHWYWMKQVKNQLVPEKKGCFILKTIFPGDSSFRFHMEQLGNEHLCLQIAARAFHIDTIENALLFFPDGQPALLTKIFSGKEFFADLESLHQNYFSNKPVLDYHQLALLADSVCAAAMIAKERLFAQIVFSWLIANANANAKNFGLIKTTRGDYATAPVFSAICTRLHELGPELAFHGGLFEGDKNTPEFRENGSYTRSEFIAFGNRIALLRHRIEIILDSFVEGKDKALQLIELAFLPDDAKAIIRFNMSERMQRLK